MIGIKKKSSLFFDLFSNTMSAHVDPLVYVKQNSIKKVVKIGENKIICFNAINNSHNLAKAFDLGSTEERMQLRVNAMLSCSLEEIQNLFLHVKNLNFSTKTNCFEILGTRMSQGAGKRLVLRSSTYGYEVVSETVEETKLPPINEDDEESELPRSDPPKVQTSWITEPFSTTFFITLREGKAAYVDALKKYLELVSPKRKKTSSTTSGVSKRKKLPLLPQPVNNDDDDDNDDGDDNDDEKGWDENKTLAYIYYYMNIKEENDVFLTIANWGEDIAKETKKSKEYLINLVREKGNTLLKEIFMKISLDT